MKVKDKLLAICEEAYKRFSVLSQARKVKDLKLNQLPLSSFDSLYTLSVYLATEFCVSPFRSVVLEVLRRVNSILEEDNYSYRVGVFQILRSLEEHVDLWIKGRYEPGNCVTWTIPGESFHHYGLAVDLVFWNFGKKWSWDSNHPWKYFSVVINGFKTSFPRLVWGGTFGDFPHIEYKDLSIEQSRVSVVRFVAERMLEEGIDPFLNRKTIPDFLKDLKK